MQTPKKALPSLPSSPPSPFKDVPSDSPPQEFLITATLRVSLSPEQIAELQEKGPEECAKSLFRKPKDVELKVVPIVVNEQETKETIEEKAENEEKALFQVYVNSKLFHDKSKTAPLTEGSLRETLKRWTQGHYYSGVILLDNSIQSSEHDAVFTMKENVDTLIPKSIVEAVVEVKRNIKKNVVETANEELKLASRRFFTFLFGYTARDKKPVKARTIYQYVSIMSNIDGMFVPRKKNYAHGTVCFRANTPLATELDLEGEKDEWIYLDSPPQGSNIRIPCWLSHGCCWNPRAVSSTPRLSPIA